MNKTELIINESCKYFGVTRDYVSSKCREQKALRVRRFISKMLLDETYFVLADIGEVLGGRNYSTIISSLNRLDDLNTSDSKHKYTFRLDYLNVLKLVVIAGRPN